MSTLLLQNIPPVKRNKRTFHKLYCDVYDLPSFRSNLLYIFFNPITELLSKQNDQTNLLFLFIWNKCLTIEQ